ncbi:MAG: sigma-54-dependent transcriptional regulator, partial [Maioricimonas sp. JB045]
MTVPSAASMRPSDSRSSSLPRSVLIVEDESVIRNTLGEFLASEGYTVEGVETVAEAITLAHKNDFQVAVCDVQLPDGDGINLLRRLQQIKPDTFVLIITAYATVESAIEAFKAGAFDYLVKPVIFDDLAHKLQRVFEYRQLFFENQCLRRELAQPRQFDQIIGSSKPIQDLQQTIAKIAAAHSNVLL